jgi:hypothetical protein
MGDQKQQAALKWQQTHEGNGRFQSTPESLHQMGKGMCAADGHDLSSDHIVCCMQADRQLSRHTAAAEALNLGYQSNCGYSYLVLAEVQAHWMCCNLYRRHDRIIVVERLPCKCTRILFLEVSGLSLRYTCPLDLAQG